jgi:hypothetical protein
MIQNLKIHTRIPLGGYIVHCATGNDKVYLSIERKGYPASCDVYEYDVLHYTTHMKIAYVDKFRPRVLDWIEPIGVQGSTGNLFLRENFYLQGSKFAISMYANREKIYKLRDPLLAIDMIQYNNVSISYPMRKSCSDRYGNIYYHINRMVAYNEKGIRWPICQQTHEGQNYRVYAAPCMCCDRAICADQNVYTARFQTILVHNQLQHVHTMKHSLRITEMCTMGNKLVISDCSYMIHIYDVRMYKLIKSVELPKTNTHRCINFIDAQRIIRCYDHDQIQVIEV